MNGPLVVLLLLVTAAVESLVWRSAKARPRKSAHDGGTALWISAAAGLGVLGGVLLRSAASTLWIAGGLVLWSAGVGLRRWAVVTLGDAFTLSLQPIAKVVRTGPYRVLRHPAYVGGQLALLGLGFVLGNGWAALAMWAPTAVAHLFRIRRENRLLARPHLALRQRGEVGRTKSAG